MRRIVWVAALTVVALLVAAVWAAVVRPGFGGRSGCSCRTTGGGGRWPGWSRSPCSCSLAAWAIPEATRGAPHGEHTSAPPQTPSSTDSTPYPPRAGGPSATTGTLVGQAVQDHLRAARKFAAWDEDERRTKGHPVGAQFNWTGGPAPRAKAAYVNLHEAEIALAQILPDDQIQARHPGGTRPPADNGCDRPAAPGGRDAAGLESLPRASAGPRSKALSGPAWNSTTSSTTASAASETSS